MAPITGRTIMAPVAAFTMALVLLSYTRKSIGQARAEAKHSKGSGLYGKAQGTSSNDEAGV